MVGGGWVGGGKIKNKDQLSLAEARVEAELGNKERTGEDSKRRMGKQF